VAYFSESKPKTETRAFLSAGAFSGKPISLGAEHYLLFLGYFSENGPKTPCRGQGPKMKLTAQAQPFTGVGSKDISHSNLAGLCGFSC